MNTGNLNLEESLKTTTAYKYALDQADIVAITDTNGIITYVNENFCKISGYTEAELLGNDHRIINSGHQSKEFFKELWQTIARGKVWKGEIKNKARNGRFYWVDTTIVPFLNNEGKPYQYVAIRHDITEKKAIEEKLKTANTELEAFAYMVAHDLRAPLRTIKGFVEILTKLHGDKIDSDAIKLLEMISQNSWRMGQLIDDLLKFSQMGENPIEADTCDMRETVTGIISSMKEEGITIRAEFKISEASHSRCDPHLMRQVWINLISNAIKYSSRAEQPVIEIGGYALPGKNVYFIKDNGIGFDMKHAQKLFQVFQRLHVETEYKGTGVGLALADRIIKKHGGSIWAEGEVGKGAAFYFSLPV